MKKTKKWKVSEVGEKEPRRYMTKKRKVQRVKKEYGVIGIFLGLAVVILLGYGNIDEGEISRNLNENSQNGITHALAHKNFTEAQNLTNKAMFCKELTPEQQIIKEVADMREFKDIELLFCLAKHESHYDQYAVGVNVHRQSDGTILTSRDLGIYQFNLYYNPEISKECMFDIACATNEVISKLNKEGSCKSWATCKYCQ